MLHKFLIEREADTLLPTWQDSLLETIQAVQQERASEVFLNLLGQLIAGGQCVLDDIRRPLEPTLGTTIVGYRDEQYIYLLPEIAHREIGRIQPLRFTANAIGMQLREEGWLIPGIHNLTTQKRIRGARVRLWQLKTDFLGCNDCDDDSMIA